MSGGSGGSEEADLAVHSIEEAKMEAKLEMRTEEERESESARQDLRAYFEDYFKQHGEKIDNVHGLSQIILYVILSILTIIVLHEASAVIEGLKRRGCPGARLLGRYFNIVCRALNIDPRDLRRGRGSGSGGQNGAAFDGQNDSVVVSVGGESSSTEAGAGASAGAEDSFQSANSRAGFF